jgi:long-chain acyl-CoA synthetase
MTLIKGEDFQISKEDGQPGDNPRTVNELFWRSVARFPRLDAVKYRDRGGFSGLTFAEYGTKVKHLSLGLKSLGLEKGDKASLFSRTRYEWALSDLAVQSAGAVTVSIYPTLATNTVKYIVDHSDSKIIILENRKLLEQLLPVAGDLPLLRHIVTIEDCGKPQDNIFTLDELVERGKGYENENPGACEATWKSVQPDDLSSIIYTSGTTGPPKGVMLSHWNWVFTALASARLTVLAEGEPGMAFLPMAHVYMRLAYFTSVLGGATMYFTLPEHLAEDLARIRPRGFPAVPRLFEQIYERIIERVEASPPHRRKIFYIAARKAREMGRLKSLGVETDNLTGEERRLLLDAGRLKKPAARLPLGQRLGHRFFDLLVYKKIRKGAGLDRLSYAVSGASSLPKDLAYFFSGIGIRIIEGYGLTETCAPGCANPVERIRPGTIGRPLPGTMIKLDEDGEILIKGGHVMQGYYKMPEETRQVFTADGWLKTGDTGAVDEAGYLVFKERKKHIIVLSTGKNVAPLPIEERLKKSRWIGEAVVVGDDRKYVAALIQPAFDPLLDFARQNKIEFDEALTEKTFDAAGAEITATVDPALLKHEMVLDLYRSVLAEANPTFDPHEQVKRFALLPGVLSEENEEITPTLKVKRSRVIEKYAGLIEEVYAKS